MSTVLQQALAAQSPASRTVLPPWFVERQQRAQRALATAHWPVRHDEAWKYTSLHELAAQSPVPVTARAPFDVADAALVFAGGHGVAAAAPPFMHRLADVLASGNDDLAGPRAAFRFKENAAPLDGDVFDLANAAFAVDGALIDVPAGFADDGWHRIRITDAGSADARHWHLSNRIDLGEGARLRLHLDQESLAGAGLATIATRIRVQRGAHLELAWTRAAGELASIARTRIDLDADARLTLHVLDAGAAPSRHDLAVSLRGARARADLGGVFLLDARRHADVQLDLRHDSPDATSRTTWRAIANDRSRAVFNGHITVADGADGTDAQLNCKSLLGSAQAEIDAKPVLEIYADDVKCAHGATVGQLDAQALFYLRSRGIDHGQARSMLTRAFAAEAFAQLDDSPAGSQLGQWLELMP